MIRPVPSISICIPSYNYARFLGEAVRSCLAQEEECEIVVLDNCSSDTTPEMRAVFGHEPRVKWHRNDRVLPIHENWNKVVSLASGNYVKLLHADDMLMPGCIRNMRDMIQRLPHVQYHGHLAELMDEAGRVLRRQRGFGDGPDYLEVTGSAGLRSKLRLEARFREPSCNFFFKDAWSQIGGYSPEFRCIADMDFTILMLSRFPCAVWNRRLVRLRRHSQSDGATLPLQLALAETRAMMRKIEALMGKDFQKSHRAAAQAYLLYKLLEVCVVCLRFQPHAAFTTALRNLDLCASGFGAWLQLSRLVKNRLLYGDPQQSVRRSRRGEPL